MLNAYKQAIGCAICGTKNGLLHFHHINPDTKCGRVGDPEIIGSLERLAAEVEKCLVFCPECHIDYHRESSVVSHELH